MNKIKENRIVWAVISLIISLVLWVYVTSQESDEFRQTLKGVRVELVGESVLRDSKNLVITDLATNTVNVELIGPRRIVASLSADKVTAQIDVSKLSQSAYTSLPYTLSYPNGTDTTNIAVNRKVPDTVSFTVSRQNSKAVPVRGSFNGVVAEGYTAEPVVFEPSEITVSGPDAYLKSISYAWVTFGSAEVDKSYSVETGYTLMTDAEKQAETDGVTCSADVVKATLPILEKKTLPLTVNLIYGAGANESNTKVVVEPGEITLAGDSSILASMNNIPITTVDLTDFSSTFTSKYPVSFDNSLVNISGITETEVKVEVVGLETRNFTVRNLQCRGVRDGFEAEVVSRAITVRIRGTAEELDNLSADNILAYADLSDYEITTGSHLIPVTVQVDGSNTCGAIGDNYSVSVEIRKSGLQSAETPVVKESSVSRELPPAAEDLKEQEHQTV